MAKYEHTVTFVTEIDDTHPSGARVAALPDHIRTEMLNGGVINTFISEGLEKVNENGTWAFVSLA